MAKPHSYEFLKQQMRELKKELNIEKRASNYNGQGGSQLLNAGSQSFIYDRQSNSNHLVS